MKKIKCYECDERFKAETRAEILNILYTHYMENHKDVITKASSEDKKTWMEKFEKDWADVSVT